MEDLKKKLILNEIYFWKKNQMLPGHYCDFLIALYEQGESEDDRKKRERDSILQKAKNKNKYLFILLTILTAGSLLLLLMASFVIVPVIVVAFIAIGIVLIAIRIGKNKTVIVPLLYILSALLLLGISFKLWISFFIDRPSILIGTIIGNCLLWLLIGIKLRLVYFTISGLLGIVLSLYFFFFAI